MSGSSGAGCQRGVTLLECALALAVASLSMAGVAAALQASADIVRGSRAGWLALDAGRNVLEYAWAAPCGGEYSCPQPLRCDLSRSPATTGVTRLTVRITSPDLAVPLRLDTLVRVPDCSPG